jgi:uncharacterized protein
MTKILILLALVFGVLWLLKGRRRGSNDASDAPPKSKPSKAAKPQAMLACAHCGVHLPQSDVVADTAGRSYCGDAHRLAGPR